MNQELENMANRSNSPNPGGKSSAFARAAMWLGGSALLGSLALVIWNRRALKSMREAPEVEGDPVVLSDDDIY
jgi:hypothetical protein